MAAEDDSAPTRPPPMRAVPALPRELAEPTPVVLAGTLLWFLACLVFGIIGWLTDGVGIQFWTCLVGGLLGGLGYGVFRWQRSASRRGSRGAWRGLSGLDG
ncbi:DUF2530 domain-containing protein [Haloactinomyces albus]|uniref:Membrane associated rhomboid family serine protease n=1 Tax=Haloactinomyces albus TaxID=1352928 RepID=A0AAE4CPA3_9ACTN|nr:DUF2530 domain-containing protein [Haloactinomyces albus]MDR7301498.1 membrane associated rhomboid family serine protease [Haloactinomyces albus]